MFAAIISIIIFIAIVYLLVEVFSTAFIGIYGVFTIIKNCFLYITNPKFRKACKASDDSKFMLKAHSSNNF